jgi:hypothetical protein
VQKGALTFILSIILFQANGQSAYYSYAAPYLTSANAVGKFTNALNAAYNPSLIPYIKTFEAACHVEKKYLTDINNLLLTTCVPFNNVGIAAMIQRYGNNLFNENLVGLSFGKNLGGINIGVLFQYVNVKIRDAKSVSLTKTGIATSIKITDNVFAGCKINNPNLFVKAEKVKIHPAASYALSFAFQASPQVNAAIESLKEEGKPLSIIFSLHYELSEMFGCALNWSTYTNQPYVAVNWQQKNLIVEAGCGYHQSLGASPTITLLYRKTAGK